MLADLAVGELLLLGIRNDAGVYQVVTQSYSRLAAGPTTVLATLGALPAAIWLMWRAAVSGSGLGFIGSASFTPSWSTTSGMAGFTSGAAASYVGPRQWAGHYFRTFAGSMGSAADVSFDDTIIRAPRGGRAQRFYVYRDPVLGGRPDLVGARNTLQDIKHAHTAGTLITSLTVRCDDPTTGCDREPMGSL